MNTIRLTGILVAGTVLLAACGSGSTADAAPRPAKTSPAESGAAAEGGGDALGTAAPDGARIPDGTWAKTATAADTKRLGIPEDVYQPILGQDGEFHVELRIKGKDYAQFGDDGGDVLAQGDVGTAGYDADGHWVATSNSAGCSGCVAAWQWSLEGDRLTLKMLDAGLGGDPMDVLISRLVMEGTYTRKQ